MILPAAEIAAEVWRGICERNEGDISLTLAAAQDFLYAITFAIESERKRVAQLEEAIGKRIEACECYGRSTDCLDCARLRDALGGENG